MPRSCRPRSRRLAAIVGASARDVTLPAANSDEVEPVEVGARRRPRRRGPRRGSAIVRPTERAEAKTRSRPRGNSRSSRIATIAAPACPVAPTTPTSIAKEPTARRRARTRRGGAARRPPTRSARITHEMRIERRRDHLDVDAGVREGLEHLRGDAGMRLHPRPDERHLGRCRRRSTRPRPRSPGARPRTPPAWRPRSSRATVNEMSVRPSAAVFCTIMSTLIDRSASAREEPRGDRRAGRARRATVTFASEVSSVTALTIACSMVGILLDDPGARLPGEARADVQRTRGDLARTRRTAA